MHENEISYAIRGAIYQVYNELGPGLFERVYEKALEFELRKKGLEVTSQVEIPVYYDNQEMEIGFRADLIVEDKVIVEIKSVEKMSKVYFKQLITYLKLSDLRLGVLVNFNSLNINADIYRKVNNL